MVNRSLHVAVLEPYYGGSHAVFVRTFAKHSRHRVTVATLPARKWKWRMRGASIWFARDAFDWAVQKRCDGISNLARPDANTSAPIDVIFCSDMLSVADLRALLPRGMRNLPIVCYFHENQLTYPIPDGQTRDYQYGVTNITSCLAADAVLFNSQSHLDDFLESAEALMRKMPDFVPQGLRREIEAKTSICPPPITFGAAARSDKPEGVPTTILWCHRWEEDKNPGPFFEALSRLDDLGYDFDLVLIGEQFRAAPPVFSKMQEGIRRRIRYQGFVKSPEQYRNILANCDIVVSTAKQETFGLAVIEAILAGCRPILPHRLSYPEVIPPSFHARCLYPSDTDFTEHLRRALDDSGAWNEGDRQALQEAILDRFGLQPGIQRLDDAIEAACGG